MDARKATKLVAVWLTEAGAALIVKEIIKNNVNTPTRIDKKIALVLGAAALAGLIAEKAGGYISSTIDDLFDTYEKIQKELHKK